MPKLSRPRSFTVSNEIIEVDFKGTICECANLLKSGITNQTIILVSYDGKWHEINVLNLGGEDSNLQAFKNYVTTMNLSLVDLGIISEEIKTDYSLKHKDFVELSEKFPDHDYIQISKLNDYNVAQGLKSSIYELTSWLQVCQRDKISISELIQNREKEKQKIINPKKIKIMNEEIQELEVLPDGKTAIPVESIEVVEPEILGSEKPKPKENNSIATVGPPSKKPISIQVFETLTPERILELQGLNERQLRIVKENPVVKEITDKTSYELAKKTAAALLKASTAIDGSAGIEASATKYLNTFKSMLKNALQPIAKLTRDPYDEQKTIISSFENAELLKQQAIEREKLQKIKKRTDQLFAVPFTFNGSIYSIGTVYCTPSQVETATDEDFEVIVNNGKIIKKALDEEALKNAAKDREIEELKAKIAALTSLSNISNTEPKNKPEAIPVVNIDPSNITVQNPVPLNKEANVNLNVAQKTTATGPTITIAPTYALPSPENKLLNALDLKNVEHLEKPAYIKCRGYYIQGMIDVANEIEFILNDNLPNPIKKSERIASLCSILKNTAS